MNNLLKFSFIAGVIALSACNSRVEFCVEFDKDAYVLTDTIRVSAACSENVDNYQWTPGEGLEMIGDGTEVSEVFHVTPATGLTFRSVTLSISNDKSTKERTESVTVL